MNLQYQYQYLQVLQYQYLCQYQYQYLNLHQFRKVYVEHLLILWSTLKIGMIYFNNVNDFFKMTHRNPIWIKSWQCNTYSSDSGKQPKNWKTEKFEILYVVIVTWWRHCFLHNNLQIWAKKWKSQNYKNRENKGQWKVKKSIYKSLI